MSLPILAEPDLVRACRVLFGSDLQVTRDFLEYLQLSGVKSAYRKKALETHPDVVATRGEVIQYRHTELFREVQSAYRHLTTFLDARERGSRLQPSPPEAQRHPYPGRQRCWPQGPSGQATRSRRRQTDSPGVPGQPAESLYRGPLPQRPLLFGHFLYYSGLISWRLIIRALIWQRTQRPRLGQLGQRFGWLTAEDILTILRGRSPSVPFGEMAIHLGLLDQRQVRILLFQQKLLQKRLGAFFVAEGLLSPDRLNELLARCREHNASWRNALKYRV